MPLRRKVRNTVRGLLQAYGTRTLKTQLWNSEFSSGRWDCLDDTRGDCVYPYVEKHANRGRILDLGCGSGSTALELDRSSYHHYTGVDISAVAIDKARTRTEHHGLADRTVFVQSDAFTYVPTERFDVILLRDSIYYVPRSRIAPMLQRYARALCDGGVFVVRMASGGDRYSAIVSAIEREFELVETHLSREPAALVLVFRPRAM